MQTYQRFQKHLRKRTKFSQTTNSLPPPICNFVMSSSHGITSGMFSSKAQLMCCHSATLTRCPSRSLTWPCETRGSKHQVKFAYTCYSHFHVPNVQHPSLTKTNVRTWHRMVPAQLVLVKFAYMCYSHFHASKRATPKFNQDQRPHLASDGIGANML